LLSDQQLVAVCRLHDGGEPPFEDLNACDYRRDHFPLGQTQSFRHALVTVLKESLCVRIDEYPSFSPGLCRGKDPAQRLKFL
jgi:hypothetical protein